MLTKWKVTFMLLRRSREMHDLPTRRGGSHWRWYCGDLLAFDILLHTRSILWTWTRRRWKWKFLVNFGEALCIQLSSRENSLFILFCSRWRPAPSIHRSRYHFINNDDITFQLNYPRSAGLSLSLSFHVSMMSLSSSSPARCPHSSFSSSICWWLNSTTHHQVWSLLKLIVRNYEAP